MHDRLAYHDVGCGGGLATIALAIPLSVMTPLIWIAQRKHLC